MQYDSNNVYNLLIHQYSINILAKAKPFDHQNIRYEHLFSSQQFDPLLLVCVSW